MKFCQRVMNYASMRRGHRQDLLTTLSGSSLGFRYHRSIVPRKPEQMTESAGQ